MFGTEVHLNPKKKGKPFCFQRSLRSGLSQILRDPKAFWTGRGNDGGTKTNRQQSQWRRERSALAILVQQQQGHVRPQAASSLTRQEERHQGKFRVLVFLN
ncbi:hypothetical protein V6Z11_A02G068700 [Gossypium hirsutum]